MCRRDKAAWQQWGRKGPQPQATALGALPLPYRRLCVARVFLRMPAASLDSHEPAYCTGIRHTLRGSQQTYLKTPKENKAARRPAKRKRADLCRRHRPLPDTGSLSLKSTHTDAQRVAALCCCNARSCQQSLPCAKHATRHEPPSARHARRAAAPSRRLHPRAAPSRAL
jgi:hypothetical protein